MTDIEVLKKHKKCVTEDPFYCMERNCFSCDYLTDDDELFEALDKAISLLENTSNENKCVCCDAVIPEGRQICINCETRRAGIKLEVITKQLKENV